MTEKLEPCPNCGVVRMALKHIAEEITRWVDREDLVASRDDARGLVLIAESVLGERPGDAIAELIRVDARRAEGVGPHQEGG